MQDLFTKVSTNDNLQECDFLLQYFKDHVLLGHLSHSGDLLLWVGVRRRASFVVR